MKLKCLLLTLLSICYFCVHNVQAQPTTLGLVDLIELALKNNPQIDVAVQLYGQTKGQLVQAKSGYLPRLSLGASVGQIHIKELEPIDEDTVGNANISASQLIYDFGQTFGTIEASKFSRDAAQSNLLQVLHDVVFSVKDSFYSVQERVTLVTVALQAVENYERHLYRAKKYFTAGVRTQIDITNAELELANARLNLLRANSNVKTAKVKLEQVVGTRPNNGDYTIISETNSIEALSTNLPPLPTALEGLLTTAHESRPGLLQLTQLLSASQASLKRVKGENWPLIGATGSYDEYETDLQTLNDQWQITAGLTWEIFSGFETQGKIAEAKSKVLELNASKHELELAIVQDVTDSYLRAEENKEGVEIADLALELAKKNLELAEGRYQAGLSDLLEFNDAQLNLTGSQSDLVATYFAYLTALARIDRAAGINPGIPDSTMQELLQQ